jgi:uncharacterized protein with HEPN domain
MAGDANPITVMRNAIDALSRFDARGCSSLACDWVRRTWYVNQLSAIGWAAKNAPAEVKQAWPDLPWDRLCELADERSGASTLPDASMQHVIEHELAQVRRVLLGEP